MFFGIQVI